METKKLEYLAGKHLRINMRVLTSGGVGKIDIINTVAETVTVDINGYLRTFDDSEIKPILRCMDSMTKDEFRLYDSLYDDFVEPDFSYRAESIESVLWLIENNFDVWGYIDAGLAIDAATLETK